MRAHVPQLWRMLRLAGVLALPLLIDGCAVARAGTETLSVRSASVVASTSRDYASACAPCHDRGGYAVRVLADRAGQARSLLHAGTSLSSQAIRVIVRRGLGAMPAMSRLEVSDTELAGILDFLGKAQAAGSAP